MIVLILTALRNAREPPIPHYVRDDSRYRYGWAKFHSRHNSRAGSRYATRNCTGRKNQEREPEAAAAALGVSGASGAEWPFVGGTGGAGGAGEVDWAGLA